MRIFWYELKKLTSQSSFLILMAILCLANIGVLFLEQNNSKEMIIQHYPIYQDIFNEQSQIEPSKRLNALTKKRVQYQAIRDYQAYLESSEMGFGEYQPIFDEPFFIDAYQQYLSNPPALELHEMIDLYQEMEEHARNSYQYPQYIENVLDSIEMLKEGPMWDRYPNWKLYSYQEMEKTYQKLKDTTIATEDYIAMNQFTKITYSDWILVFAVLIICTYVFLEDEQTHMDQLMLVSKKGRLASALAKLAVITLSVFVMVTLVYLMNILLLQGMYDKIDFSQSMQSVLSLSQSPFQLSLGTWLIGSLLIKGFTLTVLAVIYSALYKAFQNNKVAVVVFLVLFFFSAILYQTISETSSLILWRYFNLYTLLNSPMALSRFLDLPMFGLAVPFLGVIIILSLSLLVIFASLYLIFYHHPTRIALKWPMRFKSFQPKLVSHTSVFLHEGYKTLIINKGWVVLILLLGYQFYTSQKTLAVKDSFTYHFIKQEIEIYDELGGVLNDQDKVLIEAQFKEFSALQDEFFELNRLRSRGEISHETFGAFLEKFSENADYRRAFMELHHTYLNSPDYLVYPKGYQAIFSLNTSVREKRAAILIIGSLIIILASLYPFDQQEKEDRIYVLTAQGSKVRRKKKWYLAMGVSVFVFLIVFGSELFAFSQVYPLRYLTAPLSTIANDYRSLFDQLQWPLSLDMPLWSYLMVLYTTRLIGVLTVSSVILFLSCQNNKTVLTILMSSIVLLLPMFLFFSGLEFVQIFSLFDLTMGNIYLLSGFSLLKIVVCLIIIGLGFIGFQYKLDD